MTYEIHGSSLNSSSVYTTSTSLPPVAAMRNPVVFLTFPSDEGRTVFDRNNLDPGPYFARGLMIGQQQDLPSNKSYYIDPILPSLLPKNKNIRQPKSLSNNPSGQKLTFVLTTSAKVSSR